MSYCRNCGNQISDDAKFCEKCGEAVPAASSSVQQNFKEADASVDGDAENLKPEAETGASDNAQAEKSAPNQPSAKEQKEPGLFEYLKNRENPSPKKKEKPTVKRTVLVICIAAAIIFACVFIPFIAYDNASYSGVNLEQFIKNWNEAAEQNPEGVTGGIKIGKSKSDISTKDLTEVISNDNMSLELEREGADLKEIKYKNTPEVISDIESFNEFAGILYSGDNDNFKDEISAQYADKLNRYIPNSTDSFNLVFQNAVDGCKPKADIFLILKPDCYVVKNPDCPSGASFNFTLSQLSYWIEEDLKHYGKLTADLFKLNTGKDVNYKISLDDSDWQLIEETSSSEPGIDFQYYILDMGGLFFSAQMNAINELSESEGQGKLTKAEFDSINGTHLGELVDVGVRVSINKNTGEILEFSIVIPVYSPQYDDVVRGLFDVLTASLADNIGVYEIKNKDDLTAYYDYIHLVSIQNYQIYRNDNNCVANEIGWEGDKSLVSTFLAFDPYSDNIVTDLTAEMPGNSTDDTTNTDSIKDAADTPSPAPSPTPSPSPTPTSSPAPVPKEAQKIESGFTADLDGDNKEEIIEFSPDEGMETLSVFVDGKQFDTHISNLAEGDNLYEFYIGDIDVTDKFKELFVVHSDAVDSSLSVFRYENGELIPALFNYYYENYLDMSEPSGYKDRVKEFDGYFSGGSFPIMIMGNGSFEVYSEYDYDTRTFKLKDGEFVFTESGTTPIQTGSVSNASQTNTASQSGLDGTWVNWEGYDDSYIIEIDGDSVETWLGVNSYVTGSVMTGTGSGSYNPDGSFEAQTEWRGEYRDLNITQIDADTIEVNQITEGPDGPVSETMTFVRDDSHPYNGAFFASDFDADGFVFADSSDRYLTREEIMDLANYADMDFKELLGYARNEIYARHGNAFHKLKYMTHYGQYEWYADTYDLDSSLHKVDDSELSEIERANVYLIAEIEDSLL